MWIGKEPREVVVKTHVSRMQEILGNVNRNAVSLVSRMSCIASDSTELLKFAVCACVRSVLLEHVKLQHSG